jgi:hypothetical protein
MESHTKKNAWEGGSESVADPDPEFGAFLTPGSGIRNRFFRIPDLGSQTYIFGRSVTIFWGKSTKILRKLAIKNFLRLLTNKIIFKFAILEAKKKVGQQISPPPPVLLLLLDPGSGNMDKSHDPGSGINIPDPQVQ